MAERESGGGRPPLRLNTLSPAPGSTRNRKRLGRGPGSGQGKTAGRGSKGFWSRSGSSMNAGFEGGQMPLHRRVPKRGFTNIFREEYAVVNLDQIEERFDKGAVVDPEALRARRLVRKAGGPVKLLARGDVSKPLHVKVHRASAEARRKVEAAGGKVELL